MHLDLVRPDGKTFPVVGAPQNVRSARLWNCKFPASPVGQFRNLEGLEILALRDSSLEFIGELRSLRYLRITDMPKVRDLEPLGQLTSIEVLRLHTLPSWDSSGKRTVVSSLDPIAALPALRHLELFSIVPPDRSLATLERCNALMTARFQGYPKVEVARFEASTGLPNDYAPTPDWSTA